MSKKIYYLENLGCAHCAAQMEAQIQKLQQVDSASLVFATGQLHVEASSHDGLLTQIEKIVHSLEPDVIVSACRPGSDPIVQDCPKEHPHHDEDCCCGQEHHHDDVCGCNHEHHYDECDCGHEHHHDRCGCGHEHHRDSHKPHIHGATKKIYYLENLGCAHCAGKIEEKVRQLPQVESASLVFATKQLHVVAADHHALLPIMEEIVSRIEPDASITDQVPGRSVPENAASQNGHKKTISRETQDLIVLAAGALLFIAGILLTALFPQHGWIGFLTFVAAYLILGLPVLKTAVGNMTRGHVFDENFLMSIATLGAFVIGEAPEAVGIMLFFRVGEAFEAKAVARSRQEIMSAVDLRPETVTLAETGTVIPAGEAVIGDLLLVCPGDRIPLDSIVTTGESRVNTAPITGESVPVTVRPGDSVTSGCINESGKITVTVQKALDESMVTKILEAVESASASKPKIDRFIGKFARIYTPIVVFLALATAVIPSLLTGDWNYWTYTALSFLVMSCPCALVLSVPLAFFSGIGAGSKKGILFKGGLSMEAMADVKVVAMDKTGTVTKGNFLLQKVEGNENLLKICASCEQHSTHPIAQSIVNAAREQSILLEEPDSLEEIPGFGIEALLNGDTVLCGNPGLMAQNHIAVPESATLSGTSVLVAVNGIYEGYLEVADTVKPEAAGAIEQLKRMHIATAMVTGDAQEPARKVAAQIGIEQVFAKLLPQEKLEVIQKLRQEKGAVMFVGDGINDAPVLAGANVGAAMGSGADAAIEAADVVYMTSELDAVPESIKISHTTRFVAWENVIFALAVKIVVMILGLLGHANMWLAVFADTGVAMICVLNSIRILYKK